MRVEVDDARPEVVARVHEHRPAPEIGGRGLLLVAALSAAWGVVTAPVRKTTWAEIALP